MSLAEWVTSLYQAAVLCPLSCLWLGAGAHPCLGSALECCCALEPIFCCHLCWKCCRVLLWGWGEREMVMLVLIPGCCLQEHPQHWEVLVVSSV